MLFCVMVTFAAPDGPTPIRLPVIVLPITVPDPLHVMPYVVLLIVLPAMTPLVIAFICRPSEYPVNELPTM